MKFRLGPKQKLDNCTKNFKCILFSYQGEKSVDYTGRRANYKNMAKKNARFAKLYSKGLKTLVKA